MADDDEIDILGEFSFNSCLAQNTQGIPSCSNREDTVHPQWLLDSTANNWYDNRSKNARRFGPSRKLSGSNKMRTIKRTQRSWTSQERSQLAKEMAKYGRNFSKISQTIKTKTVEEIQALIEAEYGINLETPSLGIDKNPDDYDNIPHVVQEEVVVNEDLNVLKLITTGSPTIDIPPKKQRSKQSLLKPNVLNKKQNFSMVGNINTSEIFYDDDLNIGSTELVCDSELDSKDDSKKIHKNTKFTLKHNPKTNKKIGNHRRKVTKNNHHDKLKDSVPEKLKSPNRLRKDSSRSDDSTKSPKLQIVFSSGQALPLSEGEQVIKIEKQKDSDVDSDIEIDIDSDDENQPKRAPKIEVEPKLDDAPIAVPLTKFEPMPRRQKKINLDGEGGYTIMHTANGDLFAAGSEPKRERVKKYVPPPVSLIQCRLYNAEKPAPYSVHLYVSALICMDVQAHTARCEVMGLIGGGVESGNSLVGSGENVVGSGDRLELRMYRAAAAAASGTHCDMCPVSQAQATESLQQLGQSVVSWHHSHPSFPSSPSSLDLRSQFALQEAVEAHHPFVALITSQHWQRGRTASQYKCIRVELSEGEEVGYQLSVKLVPDVNITNVAELLVQLRDIITSDQYHEHAVNMATELCPLTGITYLEKCISSISHHLTSAGYEDDDEVRTMIIEGLREITKNTPQLENNLK